MLFWKTEIDLYVFTIYPFLSMHQVRKLLDDDPGNSEYADMEKELVEVILVLLFLFQYPQPFSLSPFPLTAS